MEFYEIPLVPPPGFTHAGVAHGLPGYVHGDRPSLDIPELFLIEEGELQIADDGRQTTARAGDALFHPAGVHQRGFAPSPRGVVFVWVHFRCRALPCTLAEHDGARIAELMRTTEQAGDAATTSVVIPRHSTPGHFPEMLDTGYRLAGRELRLAAEREALVALLLCRLSVNWFAGTKAADITHADRTVEKISFWIDKHVSASATVADIAERAGLNPDYLNRLFKRHTGLPVSVYVRIRKLERAKHLLATGVPVKEAAARTGFADPAYFSRVFRAHTGVAPSVYSRIAGSYLRN